jgi:TRAP transporter 4TM/12TM fusion protein
LKAQPAPAGADEAMTDAGPLAEGGWPNRVAGALYLGVAVLFTIYLLRYYATGIGGPTLLAVAMVPVAFILVTLDALRRGLLYARLGWFQYVLGSVYVLAAAAAGTYLFREFDAIRRVRVGFWSDADLLAGGVMVLLILEYTRRRYMPLFVINLLLVLYTVYGYVVPGMFRHPGLPWGRVVSALSVEMATGIFERLPQLALTLIGSFILVLAVLRAFGCIDSILTGASRLAVRSPQLLPQAAVVGSFGVAAISGSGAANAATTGSATIPSLIRAGFPPVRAAAIETASSLGGQLLPPLMGVAAFIMADFLGVSYFEVVARGWVPALIYFAGVSVAVYLIAARHRVTGDTLLDARLRFFDYVNLVAYLLAVSGLIYLMGVQRAPAMQSAHRVFVLLFAAMGVLFVGRWLWQIRSDGLRLRELTAPFQRFVETFARMTSELTLLLSTLGILTAAFTITGVPTTVGVLLMELAGVHLVAMVLVAFVFGYLVGMGLPPAPTYIVTAVVIAPFIIAAGIDPWVVHFYAFLIAVFGELSPPTSVTAAVTSRIADSSFMRTMFRAIEMCLPLLLLMVAVFTRPDLVVEPGIPQLGAFALVLVGTLAVVGSLHAPVSLPIRVLLGGLALAVIAYPDKLVAALIALVAAALIAYAYVRARRRLAAAQAAA